MIKYPVTSAYSSTKQSNGFIQLTNFRNINKHPSDQQIKIELKYQHRIDLLAYDLYGSADYWWVLYMRNLNTIRHPIWDFTVNKEIWIPSNSYISSIVGA